LRRRDREILGKTDMKFLPIGTTNFKRLRKWLTPEAIPRRYRDNAAPVTNLRLKKSMGMLRGVKRCALQFRQNGHLDLKDALKHMNKFLKEVCMYVCMYVHISILPNQIVPKYHKAYGTANMLKCHRQERRVTSDAVGTLTRVD
jgi:hypothetical protein